MKFFPTRLLLLLPLMIAGDLSVAAQVAAERSPIVHDTLLNREERRGFKQQREAWLQSMHRAAPDVDPQILNSAIRRSRLRAADDRKGRMTLADEAIMLTDRLRATWSERGSRNQAGRTWLATIDTVGSKIYVAADGGQIWRGGLEGEDWTPLNDDRRITGIRHLSVDYTQPTEPRLVVVAPGVAYRMSLDGRVVEEATGLDLPRMGVKTVIVTEGGDGCRIHLAENGWKPERFAAPKVNAVDTTGAGDTFTGYLIAGIDRGMPLKQAVDLATRAAAIMVTRRGTADVIPDLKDVQDARLG